MTKKKKKLGGKPFSKLEIITPQIAKEYLAFNTKNRKISQSQVSRLAQSIVNGKFVATSDGIGFDTEGVLSNGQQRLSAIIKANQSVELFVVRNLVPEARLVTDTGYIRSHAGSIQMADLGYYIDEKNKKIDCSKLLASVSAYIILHQKNKFNKITGFGRIITNDEVVDFVNENHSELINSAKTILKLTSGCKYIQVSHLLFLYQMHKFFDDAKITKFINIVTGAENSTNPDTCPATKLRNTLIENAVKRRGTKFSTKDLMGLSVDASNKFMGDVEMGAKNKRLASRPNASSIVNIKFNGEINSSGVSFFKTIKKDTPLVEEPKKERRTVKTVN